MSEQSKADAARELVVSAGAGPVAQREEKTLREVVTAQRGEIARALPGAMDAERFVRIVITELRKNPDLMKCSQDSFLGAVLTSAQLGLEFGPIGRAYLIPFGDECTLVIGYKGWVDLTYRSGYIADISAEVVREGDKFDYELGLDRFLKHRPLDEDESRPATHYYSIVNTTTHGSVMKVMTVAEVVRHRDRYSKQFRKSGKGPWKDQFDEMALKTVFKRATAFLPISVEAAIAAHVDDHVVRRTRVEDEPIVDDDEVIDAEIVQTTPVENTTDVDDEAWKNEARGDE